jgi:membrane carboxypeptidase/penicillin-binding protein
MLRFILSFLGGIFSWVTIALVMFALTVGAIFWMYGRDLPNHEQLAQYAPPTISRIYSGEGRMMDEFAKERRLYAASAEIPDLVKNAFISAEDKNFYTHKGYDPRGMIAAGIDALRGGRLRGASTITQQVMKNFLLSSDRSAERKIKELILASRLEETLSKDKILELYLNEIFLGQNSFGVAAAAQTYFNKTLSELDAGEAAYLASLPKSPSNRHPVRNRDDAAPNGAERRLPAVPRQPAAARLFLGRDQAPAEPRLRAGRVLWRRPVDPRHRRPRVAGRGGAGIARRVGAIRSRTGRLARNRQDRARRQTGRRGHLARGAGGYQGGP